MGIETEPSHKVDIYFDVAKGFMATFCDKADCIELIRNGDRITIKIDNYRETVSSTEFKNMQAEALELMRSLMGATK